MKLNESEESDEASLILRHSQDQRFFDIAGISLAGDLITGQMAVGVKAPGAWYRLL